MKNEAFLVPNPATPCVPVRIDPGLCIRCNACADQCRTDVMVHNPTAGEPPIVLYPDECWFCGTCVEECPVPGAIQMFHPMNQWVAWKRKDTGEMFRIGITKLPGSSSK